MNASGKSKGGWLLPVSLFAIGRCLNVFASFIAFDFMMSPSPSAPTTTMIVERPILVFVCIVVTLAAAAFASIQRIWSSFATLSRSQIRLLLINGSMLASSILLYYMALRHIGPIRSVLWQACESCMIWIPVLLLSWQQVKSTKRRGAIIMIVAYIILLLAAQSYVPDYNPSVVTPSINTIPLLRVPPRVHDPAAVNTDGGIIEGELPSIEVAAAPPPQVVAAANDLASSDATVNTNTNTQPTDSSNASSAPSSSASSSSSSAVYASFAIFISCGINIMRKRYVKTHSTSFGGKKRMHAFSMCSAAAMLIPLALLQLLFGDSSTPPASDDTTISIGGTPITTNNGVMALASGQSASTTWILTGYIIISLLCVVVPYYVDSLSTRVDTATNGASIMVDIVSSIVAACFVSICRASDPFTLINCVTGALICYGVHQLSTGGRPPSSSSSSSSSSSPSSSLSSLDASPLFPSSTRDTTSWSIRGMIMTTRTRIRVIWRHVASDPKSLRIAAFLLLNFAFMFVELAYGIWSGSLSLISDAGHMLFDSAALAIGLYASYMAKIKENNVYTYGYGRTQVISGFVNSLFLLFIGWEIIVEACERFLEPAEIESENLLLVSVLGFGVNLIGLVWFHDLSHGHSHGDGGEHGGHSHGGSSHSGHGHGGETHAHSHGDVPCNDDHGHSHSSASTSSSSSSHHGHSHGSEPCTHDHKESNGHDHHGHSHGGGSSHDDDEDQAERDHNMESIYLHVVADALGSLAVIASSLAIQYKGWTWMDPLASIAISYLIIKAAWPVVKDSAMLLMQRTPLPKEKKIARCLEQIMAIDGVISYRDPHFWWLISGELVGTLHVQITESSESQRLLEAISSILRSNRLGVRHLTIQLEKEHFISKLPAELRLSSQIAPPSMSSLSSA